MSALSDHRNPDGTYNGASLFAQLTGLPEAEIKWMAERLAYLMGKGFSKQDAKTIVKREAQRKPWEKTR